MVATLPETDYSVRTAEEMAVWQAGAERSPAALQQLITGQFDAVLAALHRHGAVLFRGYAIESADDYEQALVGTPLNPWKGWWFVEREKLSDYVMGSNFQDGNTIPHGAHAENCSSPLTEVPEWVSFCCLTAPDRGGETFLVHMANAYDELSEALRRKLEEFPCRRLLALHRDKWAEVIDTEDESQVAEACARHGAELVEIHGDMAVLCVERPYVLRHPVTGRKSPHVMLLEWCDPPPAFLRLFRRRYSWWQWWKVTMRASKMRTWWRLSLQAQLQKRGWSVDLTPAEIEELGAAVARHTTAAPYRSGDLLLVDNFQMLHGAVAPWHGPRELVSMVGRRPGFEVTP